MRATPISVIGLTAAATAAAIAITAALLATGPDTKPNDAAARIGTYDSRAIAIAFAASDFNPAREKMAEMKQAKADADDAKVKQLEHWGQTFQRKLHFQGFGNYPVDDLLANVADKIPGVAAKHHLDAITASCDFTADDAVIIDVTHDLAALFNPPEKAWTSIESMKHHPPVPFETLIDLPPDR